MGRLILTEEEKKNIKDMYSDVKSSNKVMSYLKRNFQFFRPVDEMGLNDEEKQKRIEELPFLGDLVKIMIDDKSYILTNEKKYIKNVFLTWLRMILIELTLRQQKPLF